MPVSRGQIYNAMAHNNMYSRIKPYIYDYGRKVLGYDQYKNQEAITQNTIDYNEYLKQGYERKQADWYKNVGIPQGRSIKYPEFAYSGKIRGLDTSSAIASLSADTAYSNFVANVGSRAMGFYQLGSGLYNVPARSYSKRL